MALQLSNLCVLCLSEKLTPVVVTPSQYERSEIISSV